MTVGSAARGWSADRTMKMVKQARFMAAGVTPGGTGTWIEVAKNRAPRASEFWFLGGLEMEAPNIGGAKKIDRNGENCKNHEPL